MKNIKAELMQLKIDSDQIIVIRCDDMTKQYSDKVKAMFLEIFGEQHKIGLMFLPLDSKIDIIK